MPATRMDPEDVAARVAQMVGFLQSGGVSLPAPPASAAPANAPAGALPPWVARFGLLVDGRQAWFYCEPHPGTGSGPPGQVLLDVPPGRYLVDTFVAGLPSAVARESAAGKPLVVGLGFAAKPTLLWIRPVGGIGGT